MEPVYGERKSFCFVNLGCHKNQVDAEVILGSLDDSGFNLLDQPESADFILVNTCGFIEPARNESIEMLREMDSRRSSGSKLVVTGCMADRDRDLLAKHVPAIDLFLSSFRLDDIPGLLLDDAQLQVPQKASDFYWAESPRWLSTPESYAYVKISDGCDNCCTYCRIPYLRGPFRSRPKSIIMDEVQDIIETGRHEIVLISQDSTSWGKDFTDEGSLASLVRAISDLDGVRRLRVMYGYPAGLDRELLELMAERDNICSYLDIPFQHTHPEILRAMNRRMPGFAGEPVMGATEFVQEIRRMVPDITLRTTLMTGFPGETADRFEDMLEFVESGNVDHLGVFAWTCEPNTPAVQMERDVDLRLAEERASMLTMLQSEQVEERNQELIGQVHEVVIDGALEWDNGDGHPVVMGRLESQAPEIDGHVQVSGLYGSGEYLEVRLTDVDVYDFTAEPTVFGTKSATEMIGGCDE